MGFKLQHSQSTITKTPKKRDVNTILQKEISWFGTFFGNKRKEEFYSELGVLIKAGISLKEALSLLAGNQKKEKLRVLYDRMVSSLITGLSFAEILDKEKVFSEYEYYSVKIGEETGSLGKVVTELGSFFAQKNEQRRTLINALTYPLIIFFTAILVVVFMLRMVVPMFEDIFKQNGVELPSITKLIITASNLTERYGLIFLLAILVLLILRKTISKNPWFKQRRDKTVLKIPFVGNFLKVVYLSRFTQAVALLTASKIPLLNSIHIVKKMIDFTPLQIALTQVEAAVIKGASLHEAMSDTTFFDQKIISLVKVAEETNQTAFVFERLSEQYSVELHQKSKMLSTVMEPFIIVVIGLFVGVILVSMYLPMFQLSSVLGS